MNSTEEKIVKVAKALSDKTRVRILHEIARRKTLSCGETVEFAGLSQPTVSHHIKILIDAGLLIAEKTGRHINISVNRKALKEFAALLPVLAE